MTPERTESARGPSRGEEHAVLRVRCRGTRGSCPVPGPSAAVFGGNTSCVEVRTRTGRTLIFDAGTGIRPLGLELARAPEPGVDLFLSHYHWDHIQGLPFFQPLYQSGARLDVYAPAYPQADVRTVIERLFEPAYFPAPSAAFAAHRTCRAWDGTVACDDVEVDALPVPHSSLLTLGYRVRTAGIALAYVPDCELERTQESPGVGDDWYSRMVEFLGGVDVVFFDATFTEEEYASRRGWGHGTFSQAIRLAEDAAVGRLYAFHHAPDRPDSELARLRDELRDALSARASGLHFDIATEGAEIVLNGRGGA